MSATVKWTGLQEMIQALTDAPAEIRAEGMTIIREETEGTAAETLAGYPTGATGNLRARVKTDYPSSDILVGIMRSASPHSHMWEFGTARRSYNGADRGVMPKGNVMVPIAERHRARMFERLVEMMQRRGYVVTT